MSMTKLEAVNQMLDAIGEHPVQSLESGLDDAEAAERMLDRVSKEVQEDGWSVNSEENFKLVRTAQNEIAVPHNTIKVDTVRRSKHINVVNRNGKLWDVTNQSFTFTEDVFVDIVFFLKFEELTFALQSYIAAWAAQRFQESELGSLSLDSFTSRQVQRAWTKLLAEDATNRDRNALKGNQSSQFISRRKNQIWGV